MADDQKVIALLNQIAKEQNLKNHAIDVEPFSSGGANYTSNLFVATLTSENKDDLHLFIKVAAMGEKLRNSASLRLYDVEKYTYTDLIATFRGLEEKYGLPEKNRLRMCQYYGASTVYLEEMVVLEDLSSQGYICHDRQKSVNWEYAKTATSELAKLHALSIAYEHYYPEKYAKTLEALDVKMALNEVEGMKIFWNCNVKMALNVVHEVNKEKLRKFLDSHDLAFFFASYRAGRCRVLRHGDYRTSNLMHRTQDDGSLDVVPVDYQTIRAGCPVVDLLYFIFTSTDAQFRKSHYDQLIEHYYSELRAAMARLGLNPYEKYSRYDFEFEVRERLSFGLAVAVFTLPIVTVDEENAPTVHEDLSHFSIQKAGPSYPGRLNGVVDDFVRWGVI